MSDEIKVGQIEVIDAPEPVVKEMRTETITRDEAKERGWSAKEVEAAEKRGMVDDGTKKEEPKKAEPPKELADKADAEKKAAEMAVAERKGDLPDFTMTPAQEKVFLETFGAGTPHRAMYFRMKNERSARQRAEAERDRIALELETRRDEDARRNKTEPEQEFDAEGNPIDPEDKPLTLKQLRELQKKESEERRQQDDFLNKRAAKVSEALIEQEEFAKTVYPDFAETVKLATDLVTNIDKIEDPMRRKKVAKLFADLKTTAGNADKYGADDYTASMIAYELGQMHPDYGKKSETNGEGKPNPKANGSLTPEQMKRIEENTQRKISSASLPGASGGKRTISVSEVTVKDLLKMSPEGRYKFRKDNPSEYAKLMRG